MFVMFVNYIFTIDYIPMFIAGHVISGIAFAIYNQLDKEKFN